jgi:hypothetical protein
MVLMSRMQQRTPTHLLGRVMSIAMLAGSGLVPVSQLLAGAAARNNLSLLFYGAGAGILAVACWTLTHPALKALVLEFSAPSPASICRLKRWSPTSTSCCSAWAAGPSWAAIGSGRRS